MRKFLINGAFSIVAVMACLIPQMAGAGLVGEPAPALNVSQWIKGGPVVIKPGTNVYLIEIGSTTGSASHAAITNLNYLQYRFRTNGVIVVGVCDESVEKMSNFVAHAGIDIDFNFAADNKRYTSLTYMNPVMQRSIPYAFIVGTNGDLLWHGSPFGSIAVALKEIVECQYDESAAAKADLDFHHLQQYMALARQGSDRAKDAAQTLLAERTNNIQELCQLAYVISTSRMMHPDFNLASQALDQAAKLATTNAIGVDYYRGIMLFESGKHDEGLALESQVAADAKDPFVKTNALRVIESMKNRANGTAARPPGGVRPQTPTAPGGPDFKPGQDKGGQQGSGASVSP